MLEIFVSINQAGRLTKDSRELSSMASENALWWWSVLAVAWLTCAIFGRLTLTHGWMPHDAGTLGQSAERVLHGQLPHRDFDELYTGGLSFLYAAVFAIWKPSILAMRLALYAFFLAWMPAIYYIARRVASRKAALTAMLLCVAWSIPVYPAAVPSWYNLFFATFGVASLLRYLDTSRAKWIAIAGMCGGLSCLAKITGAYYVGAVMLFLLYREQDSSRVSSSTDGRLYSVLLTACLLGFVSIIAVMAVHFANLSVIIRVLTPALLPAAIIFIREWRHVYARPSSRFREVARMAVPFVAGLSIPLLCFVSPYVASHSLDALYRGLIIVPSRLVDTVRLAPGNIPGVAFTLGIAWAASRLWKLSRAERRTYYLVPLALLVLGGALAGRHVIVYLLMWLGIDSLIPLLMLVAGWKLLRPQNSMGQDYQPEFLLLSVTAVCGLIQFPFAAHVYFFYVAPLAVLAATALLRTTDESIRPAAFVLGAGYLLFSLLWIDSTRLYAMGHAFVRDGYVSQLALPRSGIRVTRSDSIQYETLVRTVLAHAHSEYIYASPDCPEVYFLSGLRNPTRTLSELYDDSTGRTQRILRAIDQHEVSVVALNQTPLVGRAVPQELEQGLDLRFPNWTRIGKFIVRWRD